MNDLPDSLREPLATYLSSRSDESLDSLVRAALSDFSDEEIPEDLPESANLMQDLGFDSLTITEFVFFFEDTFDLKITNEDLIGIRTVGDMKRFLGERLSV